MVNINCNLNCIYQNEGKCTLNKIPSNIEYSNCKDKDCIYYAENSSNMFQNKRKNN